MAKSFFKELLKVKRRNTPAWKRSNGKVKGVWLYPMSQEREYARLIQKFLGLISEKAMDRLRLSLQRWTEEQARISGRGDSWQEEEFGLIDELENDIDNLYLPKKKGQGFWNRETILAAIGTAGLAVHRFNGKQWNKFTSKVSGETLYSDETWTESVVDQWAEANLGLVKSLSQEYVRKLNTVVSEGVLDGKPWDEIMRNIEAQNRTLSRSRAVLLARDQVGKLNGRLTEKRTRDAGLTWYEWSTAGDGRVRDSHEPLDGKICDWNDSSVYADSIEDAIQGNWLSRSSIGAFEGTPGEDFQCRCTSLPVFANLFDEIDEELDDEIK